MSLFKKKSSSYLGVDLGTNSIKFVELERAGGRLRLVNYGLAEAESNVSREESQESLARVADIFKKLLVRARARSRECVAALPNFSVFSSVITLPALGQAELAAAVQWEAKKFIPMPLENVVLDWKILGDRPSDEVNPPLAPTLPRGGDGGVEPSQPDKSRSTAMPAAVPAAQASGNIGTGTRVLLTAAPKYLVQRYASIFKQAGVALLSLETESFALSRSLVGNEPYVVLIADVGSLTTDLTVVEQGVPVLSRSIDVGGKTITRAIADSLGIAEPRAEQFKRDVGMGQSGADDGVARIINQSFAAVINEMKYALNQYLGRGARPVEKILLTGGSSFLPGLPGYLANSLGIKAFIANPWARLAFPKDLAPVLDALSPRMAISIGLAMRELE